MTSCFHRHPPAVYCRRCSFTTRNCYGHTYPLLCGVRAALSTTPFNNADSTSCPRPATIQLYGAPHKPPRTATSFQVHSLRFWSDETILARSPADPDPALINDDFEPTPASARTFDWLDLASLWVGLVVCIPTYMLASGLVELGMSCAQGVFTIFIGNLITLLPMILNGAPGTKYGIPFPVLARSSFGIHGAKLPAVLRALVACGWFGIQTHVGGASIFQMLDAFCKGALSTAPTVAWLGLSWPQFLCFLAFWAIQVAVLQKGIESIRLVEKYGAPVLIVLSGALLVWAWGAAGGLGSMLSAPSQFGPGMAFEGRFWSTFLASVTANVGFWATLSLNIPDFTRYAKSQKDQVLGQTVGLPLCMAAFTFIGLAVTSATVVIYGTPISDPIALLSKQQGFLTIVLSCVFLSVATLTTNIAANVVAPANAFVNLAPKSISFKTGALVTALLGMVIMPWKLIASSQGFIFTWLIGYSVIMGPIGGIIIADYYLLRRQQLSLDDLYSSKSSGKYWYQRGWNPAALMAMVVGTLPTLPGLVAELTGGSTAPLFVKLYQCCWFVGFGLSTLVYTLLMPQYQPDLAQSQPLSPGVDA